MRRSAWQQGTRLLLYLVPVCNRLSLPLEHDLLYGYVAKQATWPCGVSVVVSIHAPKDLHPTVNANLAV